MPSDSGGDGPDGSEQERFTNFYESWIGEQERLLQQLHAAAARYGTQLGSQHREDQEREAAELRRLVLGHYESYYSTKLASLKRDVLPMFSPKWTSSTENLFLWIGGWRPSMAIHLLYSKSGLQLEDHLDEILSGMDIGNLGDLSADQLKQMDELQRRTVQREREMTEELARKQESVVDTDVVELSRVLTEISGKRREERDGDMEAEMGRKTEGMVSLLEKADGLRLETLKAVIEILTPIQSVHFLIAAAEVHLRVHECGKRKDEAGATVSTGT